MAPMYANGYMYQFENPYILGSYGEYILAYACYIDNIFLLFKGTSVEVERMIQGINEAMDNIELSMILSTQQVDFLDVCVYREDQKLAYTLFSKPTDRNTILHATCFHPVALRKSLPYSQFLHVYRNNSNYEMHKPKFPLCGRSLNKGDTRTPYCYKPYGDVMTKLGWIRSPYNPHVWCSQSRIQQLHWISGLLSTKTGEF
ncbi:Hypothetical predicted protein [Pelobates cultripes]|uniref:Uncharacterized protein n=1 Tax=Pelobates cultripes TaxID=61616 RepID=A0AAD1R2N3_PELCU|nr:Hypothetical predicted protein [Pelobates cultripes]